MRKNLCFQALKKFFEKMKKNTCILEKGMVYYTRTS